MQTVYHVAGSGSSIRKLLLFVTHHLYKSDTQGMPTLTLHIDVCIDVVRCKRPTQAQIWAGKRMSAARRQLQDCESLVHVCNVTHVL